MLRGPQKIGSVRDISVHLYSSAANLSLPRAPISRRRIRNRPCRVQPKMVLPQIFQCCRRLRGTSRISVKSLRATTLPIVSSTEGTEKAKATKRTESLGNLKLPGSMDIRHFGLEESTMAKKQPVYTPEFRRQMVELVRAGRSPEELSREFEPTAQSIRNWVAQTDRDAGHRDGGLRTDERAPTSTSSAVLACLRRNPAIAPCASHPRMAGGTRCQILPARRRNAGGPPVDPRRPCQPPARVLNRRPSLPGRWHPSRLCPPPHGLPARQGPGSNGVAIPAGADSQRVAHHAAL